MAIERVVAGQDGVISRAQLLRCGLSGSGVDTRLERRRLFSVYRGVYALAPTPLSRRGRLFAALLALPGPGLLSEGTAARLWGLERRDEPISLTVRRGCGSAVPGLRILRRIVPPADRALRDGLPVTAMPRTLIDLAPLGQRRLRHAFEEAVRLERFDGVEMRAALARGSGRTGVQHVRALFEELAAPTRAKSALESDFLALCRSHSLPTPLVNATVAGWEVDAYWAEARLAVEVDSFEYHGRDRFQFDRDRRKGLALAAAGLELIRVGQREVERAAETAGAIRGRLERGAPSSGSAAISDH